MSTSILIWGTLLAHATLGNPSELGMPPDDEASGDGVYGRLSGDFSSSLGASLEADISSSSFRPAVYGALRYYQTAGAFVHYSQAVDSSDPLERRLVLGGLLEPFFLLRWPKYSHSGRAFLDLFTDSIGFHFGLALLEPRGSTFASELRFNAGLGLGFPIGARADGPWFRARYDLSLGGTDPSHLLIAQLEWQFFWESAWLRHSVDRPRP